MRIAHIHRQTNETDIHLELNLDGSGTAAIDTSLGFLDHMLHHLAVHGLFDLQLQARGDLQVDEHHTVEDCALALGAAFDQALGNRRGLMRTGSAYVPMDESLAFVVVDFSGRPYALVQAEWRSPAVGGIATSLFPHFIHSFATTARATIHAQVRYGDDDHHKAEALFKALARALKTATRPEPRLGETIPSTKGVL